MAKTEVGIHPLSCGIDLPTKASDVPSVRAFAVDHYVVVNNICLHYVEAGHENKGGVVVLLHGVPQFWYHSTVFRSPSSSEVFARKPNSRSARVTSRRRRGWPSGCVVSQMSSPSNPVSLHSNVANSRTVISRPDPMFTGSGLL